MKRKTIVVLVACLAVVGFTSPLKAQVATIDEALTVAENWIALIINKKGDWGGFETASVEDIQEFKRGARVIGYFCRVNPKGYIVLSLRKELAPVKAYSARSDLDPESEEGMAALLKGRMERILDRVEQVIDPDKADGTEELSDILEIDYRNAWNELEGDVEALMEGPVRDKEVPKGELKGEEGSPEEDLESGAVEMNYQEGGEMLTSYWYQKPPYNNQCPNMGCTWSNYCNYNQNAKVGCTAVAGAQIMRYWNWPPYGGPPNGNASPYNDIYDWPNMPDAFTDPTGTVPPCNWPLTQVNAVAELLSEVGQACGMNYGCSSSACQGWKMEGVFEDYFRYSPNCLKVERKDYTASNWFNIMKAQFNLNRPVQYRFETSSFSHGVVGDGWQEVGSPSQKQFHVNYGHGADGTTMWYNLDHWYNPGDDEYMLVNIYPAQVVGAWLSGIYTRTAAFPYRYFDRDATASSATFESGQYLQFLPNITVTCTSTTGGNISFYGSSTLNTRLFTRGDRSRGARIYNGTIKVYQNGSIKLN